MKSLIEKAQDYAVSRRSFLKMSSAALAGTTAALTIPGCGLSPAESVLSSKLTSKDGKWIPAACWHNCGGRCTNKAFVVDGVVIRQKTDDTHPDSPDHPQQRACVRGRSQRKQVFAADRLRYPMKRKNWEPGGGKKELRGQDEWVKISWDEALDTIASEIKRISGKYGHNSIFVTGGGDITRPLGLNGGYTSNWGTTSWGSWRWGPEKFGMAEGFFETSINDRLDLRNSELIVLVGGNPAWSALGNPSYHYLQAKKAGAKFIVIDPIYTDTAEILGDQWIPINPGTDHAMFLGMAYTLLTEDDPVSNPLIDWDFLNRCTVGFDAEHMPEGADPKENFRDYVLGIHDGIPKTPDWASEICGVDPVVIQKLAREIAKTKKVALLTAWAASRIKNSDSWPQMFMTFGAMTGNMGKSGCMTGVSCHYNTANGGPVLIKPGGAGLPRIGNPVKDTLNHAQMWDAIVKGEYTAGFNDTKKIDIQMIYHGGNARLQTADGMGKGIEAHRKVEFIVTAGHFLTTNAKYSDILLPATTEWETVGGLLTGNREAMFYYSQVVEPMFEVRTDAWMAEEIGKRLGQDPKALYPISDKQQLFNKLAGSQVMKEDGTGMETLLTITSRDIAEWGVDGTPQEGRISLQEFIDVGQYHVERRPGDKLGFICYEDFRKDPEKHPLKTESGKLEIHCNALAEFVKSKGFTEIKPIPTYNPSFEGYEDTYTDWKNKVKGEHPLQVVNPHYLRRSHAIFDNIPWLREAWPNPVYLSSHDAKIRGIKTGDTVMLKSRHGQTLRNAMVIERLKPGVVGLPHGAWAEVDEKTGIDKAGADNYLTGQIPSGQGISGWNSTVCDVEKYSGPQLPPDDEWPLRIIT